MCFSKARINVTCMYILNTQRNHIVFLLFGFLRFGRLFIRWLLSFALACFVVVVWCCCLYRGCAVIRWRRAQIKNLRPPLEWIEASLELLLEIVRFSLIYIYNIK